MYAGRIVEEGTREQVLGARAPSLHAGPAARRALAARAAASASPRSRAWCPRRSERPAGCRFSTRCPSALDALPRADPPGDTRLAPGHVARCHAVAQELSERVSDGAPLLRVGGAAHLVPDPQRAAPARGRLGARGRRRRSRGAGRAHARAGRRVGLRQDDGRPLAAAPGRAAGRAALVRRRRPAARSTRGALHPYRRAMQIVFQDPLASLDPRMRVRDAIAEGMQSFGIGADERGAHASASRRCSRACSLDPRADVALPARVLGRPAPAHLHRARARRRAAAARLRRGGLGARRLDPGADPEPAARSAGRARARLSLHHARSRRGALSRRPRGGDVPRARSSRRARRRAIFADAAPSLHARAARRRALGRSDARGVAVRARGDVPSPPHPPAGLPLPHALPRGVRALSREAPALVARDDGASRCFLAE